MGQKKKIQQQYLATLQQMLGAIQSANQPNQWEQAQAGEYNTLKNFLDSKDYRNLPTGVNIPMIDLADRQRMRQMVRGSDAGAQRAAGANFAPMVQAQRTLDDSQFEEDWAGEFENQIGGLMGRKDALLGNLSNRGAQRSQNTVGNYGAALGAISNTPIVPQNMWMQMLPGLIQSGAQAGIGMI